MRLRLRDVITALIHDRPVNLSANSGEPEPDTLSLRATGFISAASGIYLIDEATIEAIREACRRAAAVVVMGPDWRLTQREVEAQCKAAIVRTYQLATPRASATLLSTGWCAVKLHIGPINEIPGIAVQLRKP